LLPAAYIIEKLVSNEKAVDRCNLQLQKNQTQHSCGNVSDCVN